MGWGRWRSISGQWMGRTGWWTAKAGHKLSHSPLSKTEQCFTRAVHGGTTKGEGDHPGPHTPHRDGLLGPRPASPRRWEACLQRPEGALMRNRFVHICLVLLCLKKQPGINICWVGAQPPFP